MSCDLTRDVISHCAYRYDIDKASVDKFFVKT